MLLASVFNHDLVSKAASSTLEVNSWVVSEALSIAESSAFLEFCKTFERVFSNSLMSWFLEGRLSNMESEVLYDSIAISLITCSSGMTKAEVRAASGSTAVSFMFD